MLKITQRFAAFMEPISKDNRSKLIANGPRKFQSVESIRDRKWIEEMRSLFCVNSALQILDSQKLSAYIQETS